MYPPPILGAQMTKVLTNHASISGHSVGAAVSSYHLLPGQILEAMGARRRPVMESMDAVERVFEHPDIGNDMRDEELQDVEFIDELEGMVVGTP